MKKTFNTNLVFVKLKNTVASINKQKEEEEEM